MSSAAPMSAVDTLRRSMVERQLAARGIRDPRVLAAMAEVPREAFVPEQLLEFAYEDTPLPIEAGQTISQPYIVAAMAEALELRPTDRVLEVGAGSGYAAAVLSRLAAEVYAIERQEELARLAAERLRRLGYHNVHLKHGDGTLGWPEHAPYDAIVVAAGGPDVPPALLEQLALGGRLVIPIGSTQRLQELVRVRRVSEDRHEREELGSVRFVPLIGAAGWDEGSQAGAVTTTEPPVVLPRVRKRSPEGTVAALLRETAEPFDDWRDADLGPLLARIGDSTVVLIGEATHGSSEFYRLRARLTRELIVQKGFTIVAAEADWPDAAQIDRWVRQRPHPGPEGVAFSRFPTWMWRNVEVRDFVHWLRDHNAALEDPVARTGFYGLDLYSLYTSIATVLSYLDEVDPEAAQVARVRYGCLTPWERDPVQYGRAALTRRHASCERAVVEMLVELVRRRLDYEARDPERFFDALQNARLVANAERYYRAMYYGAAESWNLRDRHMFETLELVLAARGPGAKAVVWAHNSHVGDASATEMTARGETNIGALARASYGDNAFLVGFGTDHGTVAAATDWGGPMEIKQIRPSHPESYERLCHLTGIPSFFLHLRQPAREEVREELEPPRLERAIGVIYRPETELASHYFESVLPWQFDEYIWFDATTPVTPIPGEEIPGPPATYPFGL